MRITRESPSKTKKNGKASQPQQQQEQQQQQQGENVQNVERKKLFTSPSPSIPPSTTATTGTSSSHRSSRTPTQPSSTMTTTTTTNSPSGSKSFKFFKSPRNNAATATHNNSATTTTTTTTTTPRPAGAPLKRIKGFLKGVKNLKNKKGSTASSTNSAASSSSSRRAELTASALTIPEDDGSTIYNVTLDESLTAVSNNSSSLLFNNINNNRIVEEDDEDHHHHHRLKMVLLLVDVATRRFELLQLEFDSDQTLVNDVLALIPNSVTEEALKMQKYSGIVTHDGREMFLDKPLRQFCSGNDILVAIPEGVPAKQATRFFKPILSDAKVISMLKSSGIEMKDWNKTTHNPLESVPEENVIKKKVESNKEKAFKENLTQRQSPGFPLNKPKTMQWGGTLVYLAIVFIMAVLGAALFHKFISTPISPGQVVSPGIVLWKCGVLGYFWSDCQPAYLHVQPGLVSYYQDQNLVWVITGPEDCGEGVCRNGLEFRLDKSLWLGGEPVTVIQHYGENIHHYDLVPWPFTEQPKKVKEIRVDPEQDNISLI